jgi:hypothetical protein
MAMGSVTMVGVLSCYLALARNGLSIANYSLMEAAQRNTLERFSRDLRMSSGVTWNSSTSITLTVPDNYTATSNKVTYAYDSSTSGATAGCFYQLPGTSTSASPKTILMRSITSCEFERFNRLDGAATSDIETKRLSITLRARMGGGAADVNTDNVVSSSFILRNKLAN